MTDMPQHAIPCRACRSANLIEIIDFGSQPLANALREPHDFHQIEHHYPLCLAYCPRCHLVQLTTAPSPEVMFSDYRYSTSASTTANRHAVDFAAMARHRFGLGPDSCVIEVASNDGYLLRHFARDMSVLGIDPAENLAQHARSIGVPTLCEYLDRNTATRIVSQYRRGDMVVANNVLAHVPDITEFLAGLAILLAPDGVISLEFPHLLVLIEQALFDTIYHEHVCYLSLLALRDPVARSGLAMVDAEKLPTHGGSLRVTLRRDGEPSQALDSICREELANGLDNVQGYALFRERCMAIKRDLLACLVDLKRQNLRIVGYGAPAKATVLLNYCGIGTDFLDYVVDRSALKQGRCIPGRRVPIYSPDRLFVVPPDIIVILAWNLATEIMVELRPYVSRRPIRVLLTLPELRFLS